MNDADQAAVELARFAALEEPLNRRIHVPDLSLNDDGLVAKFHLAAVLDDNVQQACELLRAEIAPLIRTVLADRASMAAEKERFRRIIAVADDYCTCMAVVAARAKVRDEAESESPE